MIFSPPTKARRLFTNSTSVGNGADLTADILHSFTLPAGQLANVGDTVRIRTGGTLAASTDNKAPLVTFGGTTLSTGIFAVAGNTAWSADVMVTKTGANTQAYVSLMIAQAGTSPKAQSGTLAITDTASIAIRVNGQNTTNSVANSVTAQLTTVDFS